MNTLAVIFRFLLAAVLLSPLIANAKFQMPEYQQFKLDNGLQVFALEQHEVPLVTAKLVVRAGAVDDGRHFGLASMVAESLKHGTEMRSRQQLEDELEFSGVDFSSSSYSEASIISLSFGGEDIKHFLPLLAEIIQRPAFKSEEFEKFKTRKLNLLEQKRESPRDIIADVFTRQYYGSHVYGNPSGGDSQTVKDISLSQVKTYYKDFYTPDNAALIISGDIRSRGLKRKLNKLFGSWQGKAKSKGAVPSHQAAKQAQVLLVNKNDARETTIRIGGLGLKAGDPNWVAASVINTILGGRFTSWLNDELRVNSGLTYGARSRFSANSTAGLFYLSTFTKNETSFETIDLALKTYAKLWQQGIDQKTLDSAKAYVKGLFPPRYETAEQLANLLAWNWVLGRDDAFIDEFEARVDALDLETANRLVKELFPQKHLQFVLIGKGDVLRDKAKQYGEVKEVDIKQYRF